MSESVATNGYVRVAQFMEECSSNYMTRWFCGMDLEVCHTDRDSRAMLERAMYNMAHAYAFVGIMAEMKTNFRLLVKVSAHERELLVGCSAPFFSTSI